MRISKLIEQIESYPVKFPNRQAILWKAYEIRDMKKELDELVDDSEAEANKIYEKERQEAKQKAAQERIREQNKDVIGPVELALLEPGTTFVGYHQGGYFHITEGEYAGKRIIANYGKVEE